MASGANAAFRELGGVLGIAVLGAVFSSHGGYASGQDYVNGMTPAVYVGAAVVAVGAIAALLVPGRRRAGPGSTLVAPADRPGSGRGGQAGRGRRAAAGADWSGRPPVNPARSTPGVRRRAGLGRPAVSPA